MLNIQSSLDLRSHSQNRFIPACDYGSLASKQEDHILGFA